MKNHVRNIQNNDVVNLGDVHNDISAKNYTESGDINIYKQEKELNTKFTDANLSFYENENEYLSPLFTSEVLEILEDHRVCLVHGGFNFEKRNFIRYLGYLLKKDHIDYEVKEIKFNHEESDLLVDLRNSESKIIYLLEDIHPQLIKYDLRSCADYSRKSTNDLFIIISTDLPLKSWNISLDETPENVFEIRNPIYEEHGLKNYLLKKLESQKDKPGILNSSQVIDLMMSDWENLSSQSLSAKLGNPDNIRLFIDKLTVLDEMPTAKSLLELVEQIADNPSSPVIKWFVTLPQKQQLVALGLALFEGLYEDQFFKMMELISEKFWKHADESMMALDYGDLDFAYDYFRIENLETGVGTIVCRYPQQRLEIIKTAWDSNRRHILAVLPVIINTAYNSVNKKYSDWERFGTLQRQVNIRWVIGNLLGETGLISTGSVENCLLLLSIQKRETLQRIAARALARWRESSDENLLFRFLQDWLHGYMIENLIHLGNNEQDNGDEYDISANPSLYLKSTILFTLSYAAKYDYRNHLHPELCSLLQDSFHYSDLSLRKNTREIVPLLIEQNFIQLRTFVEQYLIIHPDMVLTTAKGLARANYYYSADLKSTLDKWLQDCEPHIKVGYPKGWFQRSKIYLFKVIKFVAKLFRKDLKLETRRRLFYVEGKSYHENLMATVLQTYGYIRQRTESYNALSLAMIYEKLVSLRHIPRNTRLRKIYLATIAEIVNKDYRNASTKLEALIDINDLQELEVLAKGFTRIFLRQRHKMKDGNYRFRYWKDRKYYTFWANRAQKILTRVETEMAQWITSDMPLLNRIASLTLLEISTTFDAAEQQAMSILKEIESTVSNDEIIYENLSFEKAKRLGFWYQIKVLMRLLITKPGNKKNTLSILRLLLHRSSKYGNKQHVMFLQKLRESDSSTDLANKLNIFLKAESKPSFWRRTLTNLRSKLSSKLSALSELE